MSRYLKEGYGSPYVEVHSGTGKLITINGGTPLGRYVTDFRYEANEEADDECRITFGMDLSEIPGPLADHDSLQIDTMIFVKWGWQGGPSQKRLICIRDTITKYASESFTHTLICTDKASYLKTISTEVVSTNGFVEWLKKIQTGNWAELKALYSLPKISIKLPDKESPIIDPTSPSFVNDLTGYLTTTVDNTAKVFTNTTVMPAGRSIYKVLKDKVAEAKDGPYVLDGRDDSLNIRKRDFEGPIIRAYNIGSNSGDDVMLFEPETFIKKHDVELTNYASTDPTDASASDSEDFVLPNVATKGFSKVVTSDMNEWEKENAALITTMETIYQDDPNIDPNEALHRYTGDKNINNGWNNTADYVENKGGINLTRESTSTYIRPISIPRSSYWNSEVALEVLERLIENQITEDHFKKYQATMEVQGDPKLEVNKCISVSGSPIASKHKGKWYITRVRHQISSTGYIVEMGLLRCPDAINIVKSKWINPLRDEWVKNGDTQLKEKQKDTQIKNGNQPKEAVPRYEPIQLGAEKDVPKNNNKPKDWKGAYNRNRPWPFPYIE